jgi:hypothetical protein
MQHAGTRPDTLLLPCAGLRPYWSVSRRRCTTNDSAGASVAEAEAALPLVGLCARFWEISLTARHAQPSAPTPGHGPLSARHCTCRCEFGCMSAHQCMQSTLLECKPALEATVA